MTAYPDRWEMAEAQGYICPWCNLPLSGDLADAAVDHIIPRCRGGPNAKWNRQILHVRCNGRSEKGTRLTPEAERLAELYGIELHEPLPTAWLGSSMKRGGSSPGKADVARR